MTLRLTYLLSKFLHPIKSYTNKKTDFFKTDPLTNDQDDKNP